MATITNAVAKINTTIPAGQRMLFLQKADFDGGSGEGSFTLGYGEDIIPVYDLLKRSATRIEIYLREGTGGATDEYRIKVRLNPIQKIFRHDTTKNGYNVYQDLRPILDDAQEVDTNILPVEIIALAGETVTWTQVFPSIYNIGIDGVAINSGTLGEFTIHIY